MQTKIVSPLTVVYSRQELSIREVGEASASILARIQDEVDRAGIKPSGSWIFIHHDLPKNGSEKHMVEFCLPVDLPDGLVALGFPTRTLPEFPCAYVHYQGAMRSFFTKGVQPLVKGMLAAGLSISSESREIYHRWVGPNSPENGIEIQFGTTR
ncbi:MAG: GyrI-like domain-containing protein [Fibrobacterota bacterium]|nr:GyrI-like domain-containing protein [Fibrobacterota bacterium]QQS06971.1 MAG: GyrI-like domain-containing protein [Fibrobacterota bacterium]